MTAVLQAHGLGKRYRRRWALSECTLDVPDGRFVGLVGPNGAGKTTLLSLAAGLLAPTTGTITVCGGRPASGRAQLAKVGFVAQDTPLYARLTVADHLALGAHLNAGWDGRLARGRIERLGIDPRRRAGKLSGGQRAQLALTLAIAKRPELLILDEPVASLDPLARRQFLDELKDTIREQELSVVHSSHLISDLEHVCDYLIVLVGSRVQAAGEVAALLATHYRLTGPGGRPARLPAGHQVVARQRADGQSALVVRVGAGVHAAMRALDPAWTASPLSLEDLVLAHLSEPAVAGGDRAAVLEVAE